MDIKSPLLELFKSANESGHEEFLYTLLRVQGMQSNYEDPLINFKTHLEKTNNIPSNGVLDDHHILITQIKVYSLIANLIRCTQGKHYRSNPFNHLNLSDPFSYSLTDHINIIKELIIMSNRSKIAGLGELFIKCFPIYILEQIIENELNRKPLSLGKTIKVIQEFLLIFLDIYFTCLREYKSLTKLFKLPNFEVLELLVDDTIGLYGFNLNFSNGSKATFARHMNDIQCTNVMLGDPINFMAGNLSKKRNEWMIGDKHLYEVGLPGRYNENGQWKPLIFPGDSKIIEKDLNSFSEDPDVKSALFYMRCTGHKVIEFVVRTNIELPWKNTTFSDDFHLWKCSPIEDDKFCDPNICVYDGWIDIKDTEPEAIKSALLRIKLGINRLAFAYDSSVVWRLKYSGILELQGKPTPSEDDLDLLDSLLKRFPNTEDGDYLEMAIEWYNSGNSSNNVFNEFLCYYIAMECVAVPIAERKVDFGFKFQKKSKPERAKDRDSCIQKFYEKYYAEDRGRFIRESYFDCIVSLKEKTKAVIEVVFGSGHSYLDDLFSKRDGFSLSDIRSKLAHGSFTLLSVEERNIVRDRRHEIKTIVRELLFRLIFSLKPSEEIPAWSGYHKAAMDTSDPRNTKVASQDSMFPNKDWRIRPEWCD